MNNSSTRINYLVQASETVAKCVPQLSQYYGQILTTVAEKSSGKLDFTIKRRLCKKCRVTLLPGVNCTYRIRKKKSRKNHPTQVITCSLCSTTHSFIMKPGRKLKAETHGKIQNLRN